jgi:CelD/BcsL family acetyltransferase involved in cellulose biosynthesis
MKISVIRPAELGAAEFAAWRDIQAADRSLRSPFLAPEFSLAVGHARAGARVAVIEDGGAIVGFFPFETRHRVVGVPIGFGMSDCQGIVASPAARVDARALLRACRLPVWEFDHLLAAQPTFAGYHTRVVDSPLMRLTAGYPAYVADRMAAGDVIRQANRKQRGMVRDLGPERFVWEDKDEAALATLRAWKSAQYKRTGQFDRFAVPWVDRVLRELAATPSAGCQLVLNSVYAGDRLVAAHLGLRSGSVLAYWFPAYDPDLSKYSAGILLCLRMAEAAAADGIDHIDLGKSYALYKERLSNAGLPVAEGMVGRSWPVAAARRGSAALSRSIRSGALGRTLKSGRTGRVLRRIRARLAGR